MGEIQHTPDSIQAVHHCLLMLDQLTKYPEMESPATSLVILDLDNVDFCSVAKQQLKRIHNASVYASESFANPQTHIVSIIYKVIAHSSPTSIAQLLQKQCSDSFPRPFDCFQGTMKVSSTSRRIRILNR